MEILFREFVGAFREFGPIFIVAWLAWVGGPSFLKTVANISAARFQAQDTLMISSASNFSRLLDQTEAERQRNQAFERSLEETLTALKLQLETLNRNVNMIIDHLFKGDAS